MKFFMLSVAAAATLLVSASPIVDPLPNTTNPPKPTQTATPELAVVPAGGELIISHEGFAAGVYLLKFTKWDDGRVQIEPLNTHVVDLSGQLITGGGNKPLNPDEDPEDDPVALLEQVRTNFNDDKLFESQLIGMRSAMAYKTTEDLQATHRWVYEKARLVVGDYVAEWDPWWLWYANNASQQKTIDDYRAWVDLARESLGEAE